jgi:hypothetical protein
MCLYYKILSLYEMLYIYLPKIHSFQLSVSQILGPWHWGRFSQSTSVSPANHSTNFLIILITRGWHNRPIGGHSAKWTQMDSNPQYNN